MSARVKKVAKRKKYYRGADRFTLGDNVVSSAIGAIIMFSIFLLFMMDKSALQETMKNVTLKKEEIPIVQEKITVQEEKQEETVEEVIIEDKEEPEMITFYTEEDVELLARLMYAEEGVLLQRQSMEDAELAHKLCGSVILHRTEMGYLGADSIEETIYAEGQYADTTLQKLSTQEAPEIVKKWAEELLTDGPIGPENMIYQSEFPQGKVYTTIDNQYFGCLK